jgi:SAM-dependent methyltransferase
MPLLANLLSWIVRKPLRRVLSDRTRALVLLDLRRWVVRGGQGRELTAPLRQLHLGCGDRRVEGWLNVDLRGSEHDVDLACGRLPWADGQFDAVVSQHLAEHLELESELIPLLREVHRVLRPGGELWLSTPDLARVCGGYVDDGGGALLADRKRRWTSFTLGDAPAPQLINHLFHQDGEHRNLLDLELARWALERAGFTAVERRVEADLVARFPGFPPRDDDAQALLIEARRVT